MFQLLRTQRAQPRSNAWAHIAWGTSRAGFPARDHPRRTLRTIVPDVDRVIRKNASSSTFDNVAGRIGRYSNSGARCMTASSRGTLPSAASSWTQRRRMCAAADRVVIEHHHSAQRRRNRAQRFEGTGQVSAVTIFVHEPTRKSMSGVTGPSRSSLARPKPRL